ncbi:MAG: hypothetical protein P8M65_11740 [Roseibacillus sp.]|nr:hypothetical protein [Roseibacillus sp.]
MRWLALAAFLGVISCSSIENTLGFRQYHLRSLTLESEMNAPRAEQLRRFHGAVTAAEKRDRLGYYYSVQWNGPADEASEPVRIVFRYRQAATGSAIRAIVTKAPAALQGTAEFRVTGPAYLEGGRVLSWHLGYYRGERLVETKQSYLWE